MKHFMSGADLGSVLGMHAFGQIATTASLFGAATITAVNTCTQDTYNTRSDQGY